MNWTANLSPASWRGVAFSVQGRPETSGGRRDAEHEFIGRELPWIEDLGAKGRTLRIEGFVVGDDFMARRDQLLAACDEAGPGTLVHPFYGSLRVNCRGWTCSDGDRHAAITLNFTLCGDALRPTSTLDTSAVVASRADAAFESSVAILDETVNYSGAGFVLDSALEAVQDAARVIASGRSVLADPAGFAVSVAVLADMETTDLVQVSSLGTALGGLIADGDADALDYDLRAGELLALVESFGLPSSPVRQTASRLTEYANGCAIANFCTAASVSELARSVSLVSPASASQALALRDQVTAAIDTVLETTDDEVFTSFSALRAATVADLASKAKLAPQVAAVQPKLVDSVLTLAHRSDSSSTLSQAEDILARNNIRHPGFPGSDSLEVLRG